MSSFRFRAWTTVVAVVALLLVPVGVGSAAKTPYPNGYLYSGGERQDSRIGYVTWWRAYQENGEPMCVEMHADGDGQYPPAMTYRSGDKASIRISKKKRPAQAWVRAYREVDPQGRPLGPPEKIDFAYKPRRVDGRIVGWKLVLQLPSFVHLYLDTFARWNHDACNARQEIYWLNHLRTVP